MAHTEREAASAARGGWQPLAPARAAARRFRSVSERGSGMGLVLAAIAVQVLCALFFVGEILWRGLGGSDELPLWMSGAGSEAAAALGLVLGIGLGAVALRRGRARARAAEAALDTASAAFLDLLEKRFAEWRLTPAERDVGLFAVKGMNTSEIAALRRTSEGTVKAQMNAIYRKAGVSSRAQLLSLFIDDLMDRSPAATRAPH